MKVKIDGYGGDMQSIYEMLRPIVDLLRNIRSGAILAALCAIGMAEGLAAQQFTTSKPSKPHLQKTVILSEKPRQKQDSPFGPNPSNSANGHGGSQNADFDSLIDLIVSTVATDTWAENGGGQAEVRPFPTGVLVDVRGMLRLRSKADSSKELKEKHSSVPIASAKAKQSARRASRLRYVSLPRLEREMMRRQAAHEAFDQAMLTLAGLQRVRYVFVYPESRDLVLAGPAGDWAVDQESRIVATGTREPVVRLDDLLVILRRGNGTADINHFGCSISPRQESLARTQAFLAASRKKPLEPGERNKWLEDLRDSMGKQDIEIFGVDSSSRLARTLVEADYHMKLIGIGLANGVPGVESYLKSIHLRPDEQPPAMNVLRWWFTLNYDAIARSENNDSFELIGQGVRVLSENEMLAQQGQRVHTGASDPLNRQFAETFTMHFSELVKRYPVYGELRNIFDLAMAIAIIQFERLTEKVEWTPTLLMSQEKLRLPQGNVPREVETVINHRVINQRLVIAGVSGGVMISPRDLLRTTLANDKSEKSIERLATVPKSLSGNVWWWDQE